MACLTEHALKVTDDLCLTDGDLWGGQGQCQRAEIPGSDWHSLLLISLLETCRACVHML